MKDDRRFSGVGASRVAEVNDVKYTINQLHQPVSEWSDIRRGRLRPPDEVTDAINRAVDEIGDQAEKFVAGAARRVLEKSE